MYFSRTFTWLLRCMEAILTKSSLLCKSSPPEVLLERKYAANSQENTNAEVQLQ